LDLKGPKHGRIEVSFHCTHMTDTIEIKTLKEAECLWFTPVILATWEVEIGRIEVQG
jgi:hypothetical protein